MARKSDEQIQKQEALKVAMEQIDKQYGKGSIMRLGDDQRVKMDVVKSGSIALDLALGVGGYPRGRIVEIYGPEAGGKTTLALHAIAEAQKNKGVAAFVDAEHALDPIRAEGIGVNLDELLVSQPDNGEQALEITETLIRSGGLDILVIDSIAALVPQAEIEGDMGDAQMGLQARLMSQALRKITGVINRSKTAIIFTNQLRMKIGVMFGNPETTPGGLAMKFYSSIRIDTRKIQVIKQGELVIGSRHRVRVVKNKVAPPFRVAEIDILNDGGVSKLGSLIDVAAQMDIVEKAGSFYKYDGKVIGQGRLAAVDYLKQDPKLADKIEAQVWQITNHPDQPNTKKHTAS